MIIARENIIVIEAMNIVRGCPWSAFVFPLIISWISIPPRRFSAYPLATNGASDIMMLKNKAGKNFFHVTFVSPKP